MQINLVYDSLAQAAPQAFRDAIQAAANLLDAIFRDNITVNISIGYGEINGSPEPSGGASAGPASGISEGYSQLRTLLAQNLSPDVMSGLNALPGGSTIQGQSQVLVWSAEEKALGLLSGTNSALDGAAGFATNIPTNLLEGVALHELTHAMGRVPSSQPDIFDLYRYTGLGNVLFSGSIPSTPAYFSLDGGITNLAQYGLNSDPSDFLNGSLTPNDAFNEFYGGSTLQYLTRVDILQMEALGFHANLHPVGDFHAGGASDILWQNINTGDVQLWASVAGVGPAQSAQDLGTLPGWQVQQIADINGDGKDDLVWRYTNGDLVVWNSTPGGSVAFSGQDLGVLSLSWHLAGSGDFTATGKDDLLWRNDNGDVVIWFPSAGAGGTTVFNSQDLGVVTPDFQIQGVGDFNGDGRTDILWRSSGGDLILWNSTGSGGTASFSSQDLGVFGTSWHVQGVGDFNGDGKADILWRNDSGDVVLWDSAPGAGAGAFVGQDLGVMPTSWHIQQVGDVNGDGKSDIVWRNDNGDVTIWIDSAGAGGVHFTGHDLGVISTDWHIQSNWHGF
jgi:hypothetical protein